MPFFQKAPVTPEELERAKPLAIPPETVLSFDEKEWYARAYRGVDVPQLTLRAVVMGTVLGFFLSFTNIYIGLKTGWFLGVNLTACILTFTISTALHKAGIVKTPMTILETNCTTSTASSAGYATGNTLVSAIPAMLLLSVGPNTPNGVPIPMAVIVPWVFLLAVLGVCLAIPMKRNMINQERLKFPSGTAAAVTLQGLYSSGKDALEKGRALMAGAALGMLVPLLKDLNIVKHAGALGKMTRDTLLPGASNVFDWLPGIHAAGKIYKLSDFTVKLDHSVVLVGAGAIVGLRVTISMVGAGLFLAYFLGPLAMETSWHSPAGAVITAATKPGSTWKEIGIWFGAPIMVSSGLLSFAFQWRTIVRAFAGMGRGQKDADPLVTETEPPMSWFFVGTGLAGTAIVLLAWRYFEVPPHYGALAVVLTFILGLVACRATGETDITPGSAMGKIMQLTYGVLIPQSTTANLMTAGITSGSSLASADLLNDLKSGYLLGANPRRQFLAQAMGVLTGTIASCIGYFLLVPNATALTGIDGADPKFPAPSAQQWKAVAQVFKLGIQNLHPMAQQGIVCGLVVGAILATLELIFPKKKEWLPSPTGIGFGLMLPFVFPLSLFLGAFIAYVVSKLDKKTADRFVIPIASGVIAGESILGVIVAGLNNFVLN